MTKKLKIFITFSLTFALLVGSLFILNRPVSTTTVQATDSYEWSAGNISTENCGLYINNYNNSGIRFKTSYNKAYVEELKSNYSNVSFGTLIVPADYVLEGKNSHKALGDDVVLDVKTPSFAGEENGNYYAYANIVNVKPQNYLKDFVAMGYIKAEAKNGATNYVYSNVSNAVNLYELARTAFASRASYSGFQKGIITSFLDAVVEVNRNGDDVQVANTIDGYTAPTRTLTVNSDALTATVNGETAYGVYCGGAVANLEDNSFCYGFSTARNVLDVYNYSYDCIGGNSVMPIVGFGGFDWLTVGPDQTTTSSGRENFFAWAEAYNELGVNTVVHSVARFDTSGSLDNVLAACSANDIAYYLQSSNIDYATGALSGTADWSKVYETINGNANNANLVGVTLRDEPGIHEGWDKDITKLVNAKTNITNDSSVASAMANWSYYVNMLPLDSFDDSGSWNSDGFTNMQNDWSKKMDSYISKLSPKFLSFDCYPFRLTSNDGITNNVKKYNYIASLSAYNKKAKESGIPYWSYIQCGTDWNDDENGGSKPGDSHISRPTRQEFRWLVNVTLAWGAKGIEYYELNQYMSNDDSKDGATNPSRNGIFGYNGQKNEWYDYAFEANRTIMSVDRYLMNATHEGILLGSENSYTKQIVNDSNIKKLISSNGDVITSYNELTSVTGNAVVGCFNYNGKTALYVVYDDGITDTANVADTTSGSVTLNFNGRYGYTMVKDTANTHGAIPSGNALTLNGLKPGEGVLIVLD